MKELEVTKEDIELLKEMKDNCLKTNVYDDEKRLLKANAITKFLVEHEKKQELIDYLEERQLFYYKQYEYSTQQEDLKMYNRLVNEYDKILSKIEKSDK